MTSPQSTATAPLGPGRWTVDKNHSGVSFVVRHLGLSNVRGRFDTFDASLEIGTRVEDTVISAEIDLSSVNTNNDDRDAHLRSTDFFDTEANRIMTFRSAAISGHGENYELSGDRIKIELEFQFVAP